MVLIGVLLVFFGPYIMYKIFFVHTLKNMEMNFSIFLQNKNLTYN